MHLGRHSYGGTSRIYLSRRTWKSAVDSSRPKHCIVRSAAERQDRRRRSCSSQRRNLAGDPKIRFWQFSRGMVVIVARIVEGESSAPKILVAGCFTSVAAGEGSRQQHA